MKKYTTIIGLFFISLLACQKEGILEYTLEKEGLQFNYDTTNLSVTRDFMNLHRLDTVWRSSEPDDYFLKAYYYGDSRPADTISLYFTVMGRASLVDREFKLKAVPLEGFEAKQLGEVEFFPSYRLRAEHLIDTLQVIVPLPKTRGEFMVGVTFDVDETDPSLELGAKEQSVYRIKIVNRYPKPTDWDENLDYLGEYLEEKYAFMVTVLHQLYSLNTDWFLASKVLTHALEEFNTNNPGSLKNFTFPDMTDPEPMWWGMFLENLGEYSLEKELFIIHVIGLDDYGPWIFPNVMKELVEAYAVYNEVNPGNPLPFPPFPEYIPKPMWWNDMSYVLGDYAEEKEAFIISVIGEESYQYQWWDMELFMPQLIEAYHNHNEANPGNLLPFPPFPGDVS